MEHSPAERSSASASAIPPIAMLINRFIQLAGLLIRPLLDMLAEYSINLLLADWTYLEDSVAARNRQILVGQLRPSLTVKQRGGVKGRARENFNRVRCASRIADGHRTPTLGHEEQFNARTGFLKRPEYEKLLKALPVNSACCSCLGITSA